MRRIHVLAGCALGISLLSTSHSTSAETGDNQFIDIYPMLCELAGLPLPPALEGVSLAPLLEDPTGSVKAAAYSQFPRRHDGVQHMGYAMRTDRYRYVEWLRLDSAQLTAVELYDEHRDPQENVNIAERTEQADLLKRLHEELWRGFAKPQPGKQLRTAKSKRANTAERPEVHFENYWDEPVAVYWIPEQGPRKQVGFLAPGRRLTQWTTRGHRFLLEGVRSKSRREFSVQRSGQTFVLDPNGKSSKRDADTSGI